MADTIWHECYAELLSVQQIQYMVSSFQSARAIHQQMQAEGYRYYLAQFAGELVGYLGVQPENGRLLLSKVYLKKEARGQGHGGALLSYAEQLAKSWSCTCCWLTVNKGNERAKRAYAKAGYQPVRQQVVDIGGGFVMDDIVFEKCL